VCCADDLTGATDPANNLVPAGTMCVLPAVGVPRKPPGAGADAMVVAS
jgi:uncharacterized protein YgbK (DUF1537 family)